jgi:uncharacterized protein DUF4136
MKPYRLLSILPVIAFLFSCSNAKTTFDYDNSTDFSQFKTYQWNNQPAEGFAKANPLISQRIVQSINNNLNLKGLSQSDPADFKVSYSVNFEKTYSSSSVSAGIGMSIGSANQGRISLSSGNQLKQTLNGTLVIDITSTTTHSLIWRATTSQKVAGDSPSPEESKNKINNIVMQMLENFPPEISPPTN